MIDRRVGRGQAILERRVGDATVLYNPSTDQVHQLDAIGSAVWNHLSIEGLVAEHALAAELASTFAAPLQQVRSDVADLLLLLAEAGLVQLVEDGR